MKYLRYPSFSLLILLASAMLVGTAAQAHHGWGRYDASRPLQLTGIVRAIRFENPHGLLRLAVADQVWEVILAPPARMVQRGLSADQIRVGDTVEVYAYPDRTHPSELRAEWIKAQGAITQLR